MTIILELLVDCMDLDFGTFTYTPLEVIFFMTMHLLIECIKPKCIIGQNVSGGSDFGIITSKYP